MGRTLLLPRSSEGSETRREWAGQWVAIVELQQEIFQDVLPQALAAISVFLDEESAFQAVSVVSALDAAWAKSASCVEEAIPKVEAASVLFLEERERVFNSEVAHEINVDARLPAAV